MSRFGALFTQGEANPDFPNLPAYSRAAGTAFNNVDAPYRNVPRTLPRGDNAADPGQPQHRPRLAHHQDRFQFPLLRHNDQRGQPAAATVTPADFIRLGYARHPRFNTPAHATTTVAGINATDSSRLLGTINDIMGIPRA